MCPIPEITEEVNVNNNTQAKCEEVKCETNECETSQCGTSECRFQGRKFNGNPRNYDWFMESFERYIRENNVDAATCLDLLTESCVGRARERIETFRYLDPAPRALKIALHTLKLHYGKKSSVRAR